MRINELTVSNYKCFEHETFRFDPGFNVIIGKNAAGKTSLLNALSTTISAYISGIERPEYKVFFDESEVRTITIDGQPRPQVPAKIMAELVLHGEHMSSLFSIGQVGEKKIDPDGVNYVGATTRSNNVLQIMKTAAHDLDISRRSGNGVKFPLLVCYGTGRLWKRPDTVDHFKQTEGVFIGYSDCLNPSASGSDFLSWYRTYEEEVLKFEQPLDKLMLKVFKETLSAIVPAWTDMAYSNKTGDLLGMFKDEKGNVNLLPFSNLSDGYRNMIGMVADMAYRCIQLNPGLKENVIKETEGIVLIDEIDLHLHPEWQKRIVEDLRKAFPKIQFIATTHSPFIVQSLRKEELIVLDKDEPVDTDPWRKSLEEVAEDEMLVQDITRSVRFVEMTELAKQYYTLVRQNDSKDTLRAKIDEAKYKLDKLRVLYADDPAYVAMLETELEKQEINASRN